MADDAENPLVPPPTSEMPPEPRFGAKLALDAPRNRFGTRSELGPRHFQFHPTLRVVYFSNEQGNSVTAYRVAADGAISALGTTSTVPADDNTKTHTSELRVHPSGGLVFCTNRGQNTVACLTVDAETGALSESSRAATAHVPQALELDSSGEFLYAAGGSADSESPTDVLTVFRVDLEGGGLQKLGEVATGKSPIRLLAVDLP